MSKWVNGKATTIYTFTIIYPCTPIGWRILMECPRCGYSVKDDFRFCPQCGQERVVSESAPAVDAARATPEETVAAPSAARPSTEVAAPAGLAGARSAV